MSGPCSAALEEKPPMRSRGPSPHWRNNLPNKLNLLMFLVVVVMLWLRGSNKTGDECGWYAVFCGWLSGPSKTKMFAFFSLTLPSILKAGPGAFLNLRRE